MKRKFVAAVGIAGVALAVRGADGVDNRWIDPGTNTSVFTAALWETGSNWSLGKEASDESATDAADDNKGTNAKFSEPDGYRFIKATGWKTLRSLLTDDHVSGTEPKTVILTDGASDYISTSTKAGKAFRNVQIYKPFTGPNTIGGSADTMLCTFYYSDSSIYSGMQFRGDRYALWGSNQDMPWYHNGKRLNPYTNGKTGNTLVGIGTYQFFAPESSAVPIEGRWVLTEGSRYAAPVGARHVVSVGTKVTGEGIPTGSVIVEHLYPDGSIRLSKAAESTAESTLTFAAFTPHVRQSIASTSYSGWGGDLTLKLNKFREEDELELDINLVRSVENSGAWPTAGLAFDTAEGWYPGLFILHQTGTDGNPYGRTVKLGNCRILFSDTTFEYGPGFSCPQQDVTQAKDMVSTLCVTGGMTAAITKLCDWFGTVRKAGTGTLVVGTDKGKAVNANNKLYVDEGTLVLKKSDTSTCVIYTVGIASNAVLRLPEETSGAVAFVSLKPEDGGILEMPVVSDGNGGYALRHLLQYGGGKDMTATKKLVFSICGEHANDLQPGSYVVLRDCPLTAKDSDIAWTFKRKSGQRGRGTFHYGPCSDPTLTDRQSLYFDYEIPGMAVIVR